MSGVIAELGGASTDDSPSAKSLAIGSFVSAHIGSGGAMVEAAVSSTSVDACGSSFSVGITGGDLLENNDVPQKLRE